MANQIRFKRASGSDPSASDLAIGEPGLRTDTAELFFKKDDGTIAKVSGGGGGPDFKYLALRNAANNGAASYPNADFTLVTSGTTTAITPAAANTLLVSVNGVIQKPNTGTSTPSSGFALNGSTIKFGANISAAPDFILYQESGGIGEPSDETVTEAKLKVSNNPVNGYFLSAQSGNTGGLTWAAPVATSCTGNSATATALATARAINGVNFDGTAAITVTAAAGTLSGNTLNSSVTASSLTSLGDLSGLTVTGDVVIADSIIHSGDTNTKLRFPANDTISFETGGSERLKITSSGNVHINGTPPWSVTGGNYRNLSISGEGASASGFLWLGNGSAATNADFDLARINFNNGATITSSIRASTQTSANDDGRLTFHTQETGGSLSERVRIDSSGKVGIGKTPSSMLDIKTNSNQNGFNLNCIGTPANYFLNIRDDNVSKFYIDSSGRVLIGTSSARSSGGAGTAHLQLEGTSSPSAEFLITRNSADSYSPVLGLVKTRGTSVGSNTTVADNDVLGTIQFRGADGSDIFAVGASIFARVNGTPSDGTDMPAELVFATTIDGAASPTERMFIDSSGHVLPATDSQYNIGSNSVRFANIYADTLYGDGSNLTGVSAGATGGGSDEVFYENSTTVTTSYSITSNKNAMSAGPISINSGAVVTVPSGSVWTIV